MKPTMRPRYIAVFTILAALLLTGAVILSGQNADIISTISGGDRPAIAVIDFRGTGDAQKNMDTFNSTLWNELSGAGVIKLVAKSVYPLDTPQQPADFKPPTMFSAWSQAPVNANYLAFGYTAVQNNQLVLRGFLFNVGQPDVATAQVFGRLYFGTLDDAGAKKTARDFAADILKQLGGMSLADTKIYFVSQRTGNKEIWSMDYDGSNQKQVTNYKTFTMTPTVSADGRLLAFTTYAGGTPQIRIHSTQTGNRVTFVNPRSSLVVTPEFTPDGKQLLFSTKLEDLDGFSQLYIANADGGDLRRLTNVRAIEVEPRVNPKTGTDILFIRSAQLWHMNINGGDLERLTDGTGQVANPAWSPDGHHIAFCWTRGYDPGNFNIFVMDIADRKYIQLTHGTGNNENPWWAPDGLHLAFSTTRGVGKGQQIYTMLVDGTNVQQLTTQGNNSQPVWAKGIN
jgi:TolB protein